MTEKQEAVLELLKRRGSVGATTKEIEDLCVVAAARDWVRRVRQAGHTIKTVECPRTENNLRVVRYVYVAPGLTQTELFDSGAVHAH